MRIKHGLFLATCFALMVFAHPALALFGGPDFSKLTPEKAAKAIKKMDGQIRGVTIENFEGLGLTPVIIFRAEPSPNELLMEGSDMMSIAREITKAKGSETFGGIVFELTIPVVDKFNNKFDAPGLALFWSMATLKKINWDDFHDWQFLRLVDRVASRERGEAVLERYCGKRESYSAAFCAKATQQ